MSITRRPKPGGVSNLLRVGPTRSVREAHVFEKSKHSVLKKKRQSFLQCGGPQRANPKFSPRRAEEGRGRRGKIISFPWTQEGIKTTGASGANDGKIDVKEGGVKPAEDMLCKGEAVRVC